MDRIEHRSHRFGPWAFPLSTRTRRGVRLAALGLAVLAAASALWEARHAGPPRLARIFQVTTRRALSPGAVLRLEDLAAGESRAPLASSVLTRADDAVGRVVTRKLQAGDPITLENTVPAIQYYGVAVRVPPGMQAVNLVLPSSAAFGGELVPGNRVELLGTFEPTRGQAAAALLASGVVLRVGAPQGTPTASAGESRSTALEVTVAVPPKYLREVALAQAVGRILVAVHSVAPGEQRTPPLKVLNLHRYLDLPAPTPPLPLVSPGGIWPQQLPVQRVPPNGRLSEPGKTAYGTSRARRPVGDIPMGRDARPTNVWVVEVIEGVTRSYQRVRSVK